MIKFFTSVFALLSVTISAAPPVLVSNSLNAGSEFNLYTLSNVNTANLTPSGANITWDLSTSTGTLVATSSLEDMSANPFASQYPAANFAIKFTPTGQSSFYSLFNLTSSIFEEVANNVGTPNASAFTDYRTSLIFPFSYTTVNQDTYQKTGQNVKNITNTYDSYGTFISSGTTNSNVIRVYTEDDGNVSVNYWKTSPLIPLFQGSSGGYMLWQLTSSTTGVAEAYSNNLFDMFPNPATNEIVIINKEHLSKIEIINEAGQVQLTTKSSVIDISKLSPGLYFVKAYSDNGTISQKFIKN